jgi:hypothetical protein
MEGGLRERGSAMRTVSMSGPFPIAFPFASLLTKKSILNMPPRGRSENLPFWVRIRHSYRPGRSQTTPAGIGRKLRRADHPSKESYRLSLIKKLRKLSPMLQKREQAPKCVEATRKEKKIGRKRHAGYAQYTYTCLMFSLLSLIKNRRKFMRSPCCVSVYTPTATGQRLCKQVPVGTNTHPTIEELLDAVFPMRYVSSYKILSM